MSDAPWSRVLLSDREDVGFFGSSGQPAFPRLPSAHLRVLAEAARTVGIPLEAGEEVVRNHAPVSGRVVAAVGAAGRPAAQLFAHVTNRAFVVVDDWRGLYEHDVAVAVALSGSLRADSLEELYVHQRQPPGLLIGPTVDSLMKQAIIRAVAVRGPTPTSARWVHVTPTLPSPRSASPGSTHLGATTSRAELREEYGAGATVLSVSAHGNGVDAMLGSDLVLCGLPDVNDVDPLRAPKCVIDGYCFRTLRPLSAAFASDQLMRPNEVRARVLLLDVCSGVLSADDVMDERYGYIWQLLENPAIGSVITTWRILFATRGVGDLLDSLTIGDSVGTALSNFHEGLDEPRFCILGDPDLRANHAPPAAGGHGPRSAPPSRPLPSEVVNKDVPEMSFLDAYLSVATMNCPDTMMGAASAAASSLRLRQLLTVTGRRGDLLWEQVDADFRATLLTFIGQRGSVISHDWLTMTSNRSLVADTRSCRQCGHLIDTADFRFRFEHIPSRRLSMCPRCGIIGDMPPNREVNLVQRGETLSLCGDISGANADSAIVIFGPQDNVNDWRAWPCTSSGELCTEASFPPPWPTGPLRIAAVVLSGAELIIASTRGSAPWETAAAKQSVDHSRGPR